MASSVANDAYERRSAIRSRRRYGLRPGAQRGALARCSVAIPPRTSGALLDVRREHSARTTDTVRAHDNRVTAGRAFVAHLGRVVLKGRAVLVSAAATAAGRDQ